MSHVFYLIKGGGFSPLAYSYLRWLGLSNCFMNFFLQLVESVFPLGFGKYDKVNHFGLTEPTLWNGCKIYRGINLIITYRLNYNKDIV